MILLQSTVFFDFLLRLPASLFLCDPRLATLMIHNFYTGDITKILTFFWSKLTFFGLFEFKKIKTLSQRRGAAGCLDYEKEVSIAYWVKWGYQDAEVIALIKFLNEITPIKSLRLYLRRRRQSGVWRIHLFCRNSFLSGTSCFALSRCSRQRFRSGTPATGI